jgi:hypothetical protein
MTRPWGSTPPRRMANSQGEVPFLYSSNFVILGARLPPDSHERSPSSPTSLAASDHCLDKRSARFTASLHSGLPLASSFLASASALLASPLIRV